MRINSIILLLLFFIFAISAPVGFIALSGIQSAFTEKSHSDLVNNASNMTFVSHMSTNDNAEIINRQFGSLESNSEMTHPTDSSINQLPILSLTKIATEADFDAVNDVLHYTIIATNDGDVTLPAVTVTDPLVSNLTCTPANGSALAVGESLDCSATHTVTQADLDAGHWANTACVDDGEGGAAQVCASEDVPAVLIPLLSITKVATEADFDAVNDVIHYTIIATNVGNVTLPAVTVTDPLVSNLTCTPANDSALAPMNPWTAPPLIPLPRLT